MAINYYPFDGEKVSENEFSRMFRNFQETGVVPAGLEVTADSSGMNVKVDMGDAFVRGHFFTSTAIETLTVSPSTAYPRIDTILLKLDTNVNSIALECRAGEPAAVPIHPVLTQTETGVYELPIADVAVGANVVTIVPADVTDRRVWTSGNVRRDIDSGALEFIGRSGPEVLARFSSPLTGSTFHVTNVAPIDSLGEDGDVCFEF